MSGEYKFFDPDIIRKGQLLDNHLKEKGASNKAPLFSTLEFNLSGLCNRKCAFCPRHDPSVFPNIDEHISVNLYEKIMKDISAVDFDGTILYSAFGEPLLHRNINELIVLSKKYCPKARVEMITNGDLLTVDKLIELFNIGLTTICISMYDGPYQKDHFMNLKEQAGLDDTQVVLRVRWLSAQEHFGITLTNRAGMLEMKEVGITAVSEPAKRACYYPFYQTLIDYDGRVLLCTHDWGRKLIVGDVKANSIIDIWNSRILKEVRSNLARENRHFSPCNLCSVKGTFMGRDHFDRWVSYYKLQGQD